MNSMKCKVAMLTLFHTEDFSVACIEQPASSRFPLSISVFVNGSVWGKTSACCQNKLQQQKPIFGQQHVVYVQLDSVQAPIACYKYDHPISIYFILFYFRLPLFNCRRKEHVVFHIPLRPFKHSIPLRCHSRVSSRNRHERASN